MQSTDTLTPEQALEIAAREQEAREAQRRTAETRLFHALAESIFSTVPTEAPMSERAEALERSLREVWLEGQPDFRAVAESITSSLTTPATMTERIETALRRLFSPVAVERVCRAGTEKKEEGNDAV
jgi:hypothetical protein